MTTQKLIALLEFHLKKYGEGEVVLQVMDGHTCFEAPVHGMSFDGENRILMADLASAGELCAGDKP